MLKFVPEKRWLVLLLVGIVEKTFWALIRKKSYAKAHRNAKGQNLERGKAAPVKEANEKRCKQ